MKGNWNELINPGKAIYTAYLEGDATFSPGGKYLLFSRKDDIYWVYAKIIDELKPKELN